MKVTKPSFFVIERPDGATRRCVRLVSSLPSVLKTWGPATRISPIYAVDGTRRNSPLDFLFPGQQTLLMVGPVHPDQFLMACGNPKMMWLGLGLYNLLVIPVSGKQLLGMLAWAKEKSIATEVWTIKDGSIIRPSIAANATPKANDWRDEIASLADLSLPAEICDAIAEYCPLAGSTLSRSRQHLSKFNISNDLRDVNDLVADLLDGLSNKVNAPDGPSTAAYQALGELLTLNAGLSRFASQTFAGISPVQETECHFWSHSALGIGVASLALLRLRRFLETTLGAARLPARIAGLALIRNDIPDLCRLKSTDRFWLADHLNTAHTVESTEEALVPVLTYYSSRDGYRSTSTTLSAPLAAVSACNSMQWSLLTTTHELSHIIVRSVLAEFFPDLDEPKQLQDALALFARKKPAVNLLEEIRRYLLLAVVGMDAIATARNGSLDVDEDKLLGLLDHWHHEVEEILVHTFDFMYFYGRDTDKYVNGIWASWGTIPNVANRVPDYVVRTICAVLSSHLLKGKEAEETAKDQVLRALTSLKDSKIGGPYIKRAIQYIQEHWVDEIQPQVFARKPLVRITVGFLFSQSIATALRSEAAISGDATKNREGYTLKVDRFEFKQIRNPLRFVEFFTTSTTPSALTSMWMMYVLAFCVDANAN